MKKQLIELKGDLLHLYESRLVRTIAVPAFLDSIASNRDIITPVLPPGCKVYSVNPANQQVCLMMERPPKLTTLLFNGQPYSVALPFIQFYMTFGTGGTRPAFMSLHLSCTKVPVKDMNDLIYILPLPNQFDGGVGNTCTGGIRLSGTTVYQLAIDLYNQYFGASFNRDLPMRYPKPLSTDTHEAAIKKWAELSVNNIMLGVSDVFEYEPHRYLTVGGKFRRGN